MGFASKNRDNLLKLSGDLPLAIRLAADFHDTFKAADVQASVAAAEATAPNMAQPKKLTAAQAAAHIDLHGMSAQEEAIFDRASQASG